MPEHASQLYSRNVQALLDLLTAEDGALSIDPTDEIVQGACVAGLPAAAPTTTSQEA